MPIDDHGLRPGAANHLALTPLPFLERTAEVYPDRLAIVYGTGPDAFRQTWRQTAERCRRPASALQRIGIGRRDTVAVLLPNTPPMVEAHFGVPWAGAVLNAINTRLDAAAIAFMLDHGQARAVIADAEYADVLRRALTLRQNRAPLPLIVARDPAAADTETGLDAQDYDAVLATGDPDFPGLLPEDEWDPIALNYTSGTTGNPKGVLYHHRGAALNALSNILEWDMPKHPVYLWTLPMFHCNGWCFPWTVAARAGVNVCLRRVEAAAIVEQMRAWGVTHYCGAPVVHAMIANAPEALL
uniref:AMP-binding protein n=1 Tax=Tepidimonas sp. TaxID=2002775 RepID=UPI002FE1B5AA